MTGSEVVAVEVFVNGQTIHRTISARITLAEFVREELGLTGTKISCGMQVCGVCTVLVDGEPVSSCTYLAADLDGREVLTIEGLGDEGRLDPVQQAFIDHFAFQCGYCTPGFILMAKALLDQHPDASEEMVREYLDGNLCRCTGYRPIVDAVLDAGARLREAQP